MKVVLGVQWMYSLEKYSTNYQNMEMEFTGAKGQKVVLRGMNTYPPTAVTSHRMEAVLRQRDIEWAAKCLVTFNKPPNKATQHPADIEALLQKHKAVFRDSPAGRPPNRGFERSFGVGDFVYLRLQPYRQSSLKKKGAEKLKPHFYGPYKIIRKVGEVAYELELPTESKIHNVFHVSNLKKEVKQPIVTYSKMPPIDDEGKLILIPQRILEV